MIEKEVGLLRLARKRQEIRYEGYGAISDYNGGVWECDYISPYSKSAHNTDADVMVILQDWCSEKSFGADVNREDLDLGYSKNVRTNEILIELLGKHLKIKLGETYATNIFPYIKKGAMNAPIPQKDLVRSALDFIVPAINLIIPKIVVCLGLNTFNSLRIACGNRPCYPMDKAINSPFMLGNTKIFAQAHTGQIGQNNRNKGGVERVTSDWQRMSSYYNDIKKVSHTHAFQPVETNISTRKKKISEIISSLDVENHGHVELLCNALEDGSIFELEGRGSHIESIWKNGAVVQEITDDQRNKTNIIWKDEMFVVESTKEKWCKADFLKLVGKGRINLKRINLRSDLLNLSDTQIRRKLGQTGMSLTMDEMAERGMDVWGS